MPPPSLFNDKLTTAILIEVFIQMYIASRLLMISESSNEADDDAADEDAAFENLWSSVVSADLPARVKERVEAKIRKDSLDNLINGHNWETFYNAAHAYIRRIAEHTEVGVDLRTLVQEVKTQLLTDAPNVESANSVVDSSSQDGTAEPATVEPSRDTSVDLPESREKSANEDDDDDIDAAVRGEILAELLARENSLAAANRAAKGKGRAETPPTVASSSAAKSPSTPANNDTGREADALDVSSSEVSKTAPTPSTTNRNTPSPTAAPPSTSEVTEVTSPAPSITSALRSRSTPVARCQLTETGEPIVPAAKSPALEDPGLVAGSFAQSRWRRRKAWSREDEEELERGLALHYAHSARWRAILMDGMRRGRFEGRTNVMLKDKARQMKEARRKAGLALGGFKWAPDRLQ
ncbi:hypothetical protein HDU86_004545 [Geranomyces michiganensis]|nr:hypothetical protein HDU86_004545 [Geranomyces michiganensis]